MFYVWLVASRPSLSSSGLVRAWQRCVDQKQRKAGSARLAELGASDREIMAITGHQTAKEVDRYTKGVRQKKLAASAMEKWEQGRNE